MGDLLDSSITLLPVFLALLVIAAIGAGVIAFTTRSTARQHRSRHDPGVPGQGREPSVDRARDFPAEGPWARQGGDPVSSSPERNQ